MFSERLKFANQTLPYMWVFFYVFLFLNFASIGKRKLLSEHKVQLKAKVRLLGQQE